jgi:hypothetical protein
MDPTLVGAVVGALVGGLLTITGSVATALISDKRSRTNQHREAHLASGAEALSALQNLNRQLINVAREPEPDKPNAGNEFWSDLHAAATRWNSARYIAALYCSQEELDLLAELDAETDKVDGARDEQIMAKPRIPTTSTAARRIGSELFAGGSDCVRPIFSRHSDALGLGHQSSSGISANKQEALMPPRGYWIPGRRAG